MRRMIWQRLNIQRLGKLLLPSFLRKSTTLHLLKVALKPVDDIYTTTLYKMQHDSTVIYLEKMLNEWFEVASYDTQDHIATRTVYISDAPVSERDYIYQPAENQPMYLETVYLGNPYPVNYKFIVNIPSSYVFVEAKLRAVIDYYKLAGKKYIIQTYEL